MVQVDRKTFLFAFSMCIAKFWCCRYPIKTWQIVSFTNVAVHLHWGESSKVQRKVWPRVGADVPREMVFWTRSPVFFSWSFTGLTESWSRGALCSALIGQSMPCAFKAVCKAKYHIPGWDVSIHLYRFTRESDLNFAAASYRNGAIICQPWGLRRYHCRDIRDELGDMNIQN